MKQFLKKALCLLCTFVVLTAASLITVSAASTVIILSSNSPKPGDNVTVTVKINADQPMYAVDATVTYDSSVLKYVSGAGSSSGNKLKLVNELSAETSISYNITFSAVAEGKCSISASAEYSDMNLATHTATASGVVVNVKKAAAVSSAAPSNDATLSALSVDGKALTPAFSKNVTSYSITIENSTSAATINATASKSGAKISGLGEKQLEVGDNKFTVTVTAPDGKTTKAYELNIRRATLDESMALNPAAVIIDGKLCHINTNLSAVNVPAGFALTKASYNGADMDVFKSESGDYTLFYITRDEDAYADYYIYKEQRDEFVPLEYMTVNNKLVIFAQLPEQYALPAGYYETAVTLGNAEVKAFCSEDERLADQYIIYCYTDGKEQFYRFDNLELSLQRAPEFELLTVEQKETKQGLIESFLALDMLTRILLCAVVVMAAVIIVLIAFMAVSAKRRRRHSDDELELGEDIDLFFRTVNSQKNSDE